MGFKQKKSFAYFSWLKALLIRNLILLIHYTKIRLLSIVLLILISVVVLKRPELDGLSSLLYGSQVNGSIKYFPLFWFFFILSPILVVGDASQMLLKQDFKSISSIPYSIHIEANTLVLSLLLIFIDTLALLANQLTIRHIFFLSYLFCFQLWLLIFFQILSVFFIGPLISIMLISAILIINSYLPIISIINQTMLSRFNPELIWENLGLLIFSLFLLIFITKLRIKNIDFIKGEI